MNDQEELDRVRHLLDLGYEDPREVAVCRAAEKERREARCREAERLLASGRIGEAFEPLEALCEEAPGWPAPHRLLAGAYYTAGRYDLARAHLEWLTYHGIETPQLALLQGAVELAERRFDAALDQAAYALCISDGLAGANNLIGEIHSRRGQLDAAEEAYRRELEYQPSDPTALAGMAAVALRRGEYEQAADRALHALEKNLRLPAVHYCLGVALARLGRAAEAVTALESAARLDPNFAAPFRRLEKISLEQFHDPARAEQYRVQGRERIERRRSERTRKRACQPVLP